MTRTQMYLTPAQIGALDRLARRHGIGRSALVRRAVDALLAADGAGQDWKSGWAEAAGAWAGRKGIVAEMRAPRRRLARRRVAGPIGGK